MAREAQGSAADPVSSTAKLDLYVSLGSMADSGVFLAAAEE